MEQRQIKGMEIVKTLGKYIKPIEGGWTVPSQSSNDTYKVNEEFVCTCPDCQTRNVTCKHAFAVRYYLQAEQDTPEGVKTNRVRLTYPQAWKAYNAAQTTEVREFDRLLSSLVKEVAEPEQKMGRPRMPLQEGLFCSIQKVYSQLSSRRAASLYFNATERQQIARTPSYNAINVFLNRKDITPILQHLVAVSASPLKAIETDFAVDSTGFRTTCFTQYAEEKYGLGQHHDWVKAHAIVGTKTNVVAGVEVTEANGADCPQFPILVERIAANGFNVKEISADKAYSSRNNYKAADEIGGQAYIPFKSNATGKKQGSMLWRKMYYYFQLHADEFYEHYHKRSNVESTFAAIKKKFGDGLKSKNRTAQVNELLCKVIAYNMTVVIHEMNELGITPDFCSSSPVGASAV